MAVRKVLIVIFIHLTSTVFCLNFHQPDHVGIIGGHNVSIESVPYMASLRLNGTIHYCGASIIHERFILTAAHCIVPNRQYKVQVGTSHVDDGGTVYDVEKIIAHELYNDKTGDFDICLIKLKTNLTFSSKVKKITLANNKIKLRKNSMLDVTGWGSTELNGTISNELQQVKIPIVPIYSCRLVYFKLRRAITKRMLCAGGHGKDSCQGDSGGPLTYKNIQVGITSFGSGCGNLPGVYTKVTTMLPWIHDTMENNI